MEIHLDSSKLAYLIEISFVLNLAYLELKSFKIAHSIKNKIKEYTARYAGMRDVEVKGTLGDQSVLHATYTALIDFHKGTGCGWAGNRRKDERRKNNHHYSHNQRRHLGERRQKTCKRFGNIRCRMLRLYYKWLLCNCLDRTIAKLLLGSIVLILITITWIEADHKQQVVSTFLASTLFQAGWDGIFWTLLFPIVVIATMYPAFMMYLSRNLVHFVLGSREEDYEKNEECGRLNQLGKDFLSNFERLSVDSLRKEYKQTVATR